MSCCGQPVETCIEVNSSKAVTLEPWMNEASFEIYCGPNASYSSFNMKDCIQGCGDCSCDDVVTCRCIPKNKDVSILTTIKDNNGHCTSDSGDGNSEDTVGSIVVTYYSNGTVIYTTTIQGDDPLVVTPFTVSFAEEGKYTIKLTVTNCCGTCTVEKQITVGPPLQLKRIGCGVFEIEDYIPRSTGTRLRITLTDVSGKEIQKYIVENYNPKDTTSSEVIYNFLQFTVPYDGIYIISIDTIDSFGEALTSKKFTIYEFCNIIECYKNLVEKYLCTDCDCVNKSEAYELQQKINAFLATAFAFFASVDIQYGNTYGLLHYQSNQLSTLRNHELLLKQLHILCDQCDVTSNTGCNCS